METSTASETRRVGFAGLGAMGFGMTSNLLKAGYSVAGFDVSPKALSNFSDLGGQASSSVRDASHGQDRFFVMVASPDQVDSLVFGAGGLSASLQKSAILCLFSTLPPAYVMDLKSRLEAAGRPDIRLVDCPVSGGVVGAKAGKLSIMLGGDDATISEIRPELESVSAPGRLFPTGGLGSASIIKMLNQHLAGTHIAVAAEALAFAKALGLSSREAYKVLMNSEGASWIMGDRGISMLDAEWSPKSAVTIFTKDLGIVNDAADGVSLPCPIASVALQSFVERAARGYGRDDDASVVCNYEDITGLKVAEPESGVSLPSLSESPPNERAAVVLVASKEWERRFNQALESKASRDGENRVQILSHDGGSLSSQLETLPENTLVGLMDYSEHGTYVKELASKYSHLQFFDYQVILSNDHKSHQILFTDESSLIATALETSLDRTVSPVPVKGPLGSATKMYLVVQLGSLAHVTAAAECYSLALAKGVSVQLVYDLISGAAGSSAQFNQVFPKMVQGDFSLSPDSDLGSMEKSMGDIKTLKAVATGIKFPSRLLDATHQIFKRVNREMGSQVSTASLISSWHSRENVPAKL